MVQCTTSIPEALRGPTISINHDTTVSMFSYYVIYDVTRSVGFMDPSNPKVEIYIDMNSRFMDRILVDMNVSEIHKQPFGEYRLQ